MIAQPQGQQARADALKGQTAFMNRQVQRSHWLPGADERRRRPQIPHSGHQRPAFSGWTSTCCRPCCSDAGRIHMDRVQPFRSGRSPAPASLGLARPRGRDRPRPTAIAPGRPAPSGYGGAGSRMMVFTSMILEWFNGHPSRICAIRQSTSEAMTQSQGLAGRLLRM